MAYNDPNHGEKSDAIDAPKVVLVFTDMENFPEHNIEREPLENDEKCFHITVRIQFEMLYGHISYGANKNEHTEGKNYTNDSVVSWIKFHTVIS